MKEAKPNWVTGRRLIYCRANTHRQSIRLGLIGLCLVLSISYSVSSTIIVSEAIGVLILIVLPGRVLVGQYLYLRFHRLTIYEDGIAIGFWPRTRQFRWSDFTALSIHRYRERDIGINLYINRRRVLTINRNYQHAELITKAIAVRTAEALVSHCLEVFRTEGAIEIGRMRLSNTGIDYRGRHWAWQEIYVWRFEGNYLSFYQYGATLILSINLYKVKNAYVLPWVLEGIYLHWKSHVDISVPLRVLPNASDVS